jgi:hypothetical protein
MLRVIAGHSSRTSHRAAVSQHPDAVSRAPQRSRIASGEDDPAEVRPMAELRYPSLFEQRTLHLPRNSGLRFSMNAARPSWTSSDVCKIWLIICSSRMPSSRDASRDRRASSFAA